MKTGLRQHSLERQRLYGMGLEEYRLSPGVGCVPEAVNSLLLHGLKGNRGQIQRKRMMVFR
jgi:hypothetical protein